VAVAIGNIVQVGACSTTVQRSLGDVAEAVFLA
jgi:hypothetical protein